MPPNFEDLMSYVYKKDDIDALMQNKFTCSVPLTKSTKTIINEFFDNAEQEMTSVLATFLIMKAMPPGLGAFFGGFGGFNGPVLTSSANIQDDPSLARILQQCGSTCRVVITIPEMSRDIKLLTLYRYMKVLKLAMTLGD